MKPLQHAQISAHRYGGRWQDWLRGSQPRLKLAMPLHRIKKLLITRGGVDICALYDEGASIREIASLLGTTRETVKRWLKANGLTSRNRGGGRWAIGRSSVNHQFYDVLDSEEKAYWLGFFSADGTIIGNVITISVHEQDANHLEKYRSHLLIGNPSHHYVNRRGTPYARVSFSSPQMVSALHALGVKPRKSWDLRPAPIRAELRRHYWRGLIDGDGYLGTYRNRGVLRFSIGFCGTEPMVTAFTEFCRTICNTPAKARKTQWEGHYTTSLMGSRAELVARTLYENSRVHLERKITILDSWLSSK